MLFIVWKQNKKQNKNKKRTKEIHTKNKANIKIEGRTENMITKTKTTEETKKHCQKLEQLGFRKVDVRKVWFQWSQQTLTNKKVTKQRQTEETKKQIMLSKKELMDENQREKMNF